MSAAPNSVARPAGGLAGDLSTTAAKKQAIDTFEARRSAQAPVVPQPAQVAAKAAPAVPLQRHQAAAPTTSYQPTTSYPDTRLSSNDAYYQQRLDEERRRARYAEDALDDAARRTRMAQLRAAEAEMAAAQARRRAMTGAAVGGAAGYAGASAMDDAPAVEQISPAPSLHVPALNADRPVVAAADDGDGWGRNLVMLLILIPSFGFLFWAIYSRFIAQPPSNNTRRYTL